MKINIKELVVFSMLGTLMYISKVLMSALPNIHLIGVFVIATTIVYRKKALYPIYVFVFITGLFNGFAHWWYSYLYIWTALWGVTMLLPHKKLPRKIKPIIYMFLCGLHGLLFSILYLPVDIIFLSISFKQIIPWYISGLPYDILHCAGNFLGGILICPIISALKLANKYANNN